MVARADRWRRERGRVERAWQTGPHMACEPVAARLRGRSARRDGAGRTGVLYRNLARLGFLGDRDAQRQHAIAVRGADVVDRYPAPQAELPGEGAGRPLAGEPRDAFPGSRGPLGSDGQRAVVDVDIDAVGLDAGQVDLG